MNESGTSYFQILKTPQDFKKNKDFWRRKSIFNWMKSLAILCSKIDFSKDFYGNIKKKGDFTRKQANELCKKYLFSLDHLRALETLIKVSPSTNIARISVISWYYGVYGAAQAMIMAQQGEGTDSHIKTANTWGTLFLSNPIMTPAPFCFHAPIFDEKNSKKIIDDLKGGQKGKCLIKDIKDSRGAKAACGSYLKGTIDWYKEKDYNINVVNFIHQAFRCRGQANYRDVLPLSQTMGNDKDQYKEYVENLYTVLKAFVCLSEKFCLRRVGEKNWDTFKSNVECHIKDLSIYFSENI